MYVYSSKLMGIQLILTSSTLRCMTRSLLDSSVEMEFLVSDESPYLSHHPCKILRQEMLILKVKNENVAKVQKWFIVMVVTQHNYNL